TADPKIQNIRDTLHQLQDNAQFPDPTHLKLETHGEDLIRLAEAFRNAGHAEIGVQLLGHLEVRELLAFYHVRELEAKFKDEPPPAPPHGETPESPYTHFGLPFVPGAPNMPPEVLNKVRIQKFIPQYVIDKVTGAHPSGFDLRKH